MKLFESRIILNYIYKLQVLMLVIEMEFFLNQLIYLKIKELFVFIIMEMDNIYILEYLTFQKRWLKK